MKILICYDGSPDAQAAISTAGSLFAGRYVTVLTIWEGLSEVLARGGARWPGRPDSTPTRRPPART